MRILKNLFVAGAGCALLCLAPGCDRSGPRSDSTVADYVFVNGGVYTVDADRIWAEAVAIRGVEIVFVGSNDGVGEWIGDRTKVTDLRGLMLLPGFHDSHAHLITGGILQTECNLLELYSREEVTAKLNECTEFEGTGTEKWIGGGGWENYLWPNGNPHKSELDEIFPDRPVFLESNDGHSAWVNSLALELAAIDGDTPDPPRGVIVRDPVTRDATGTLRESAMTLVKDLLPPWSMEQRIQGLEIGIRTAHGFGITAIIEPGLEEYLIRPFVELADADELKLRVLVSVSPIGWQPDAFGDELYDFLATRNEWRRPNLDVDSVKIYMDGVIEAGTAAMLQPLLMEEYGKGMRFYTQEKVNEYITHLDKEGFQVHVHAIGDAGVRMALDGFEAARAANGATDNRHHIVHLQLVDPYDYPRFAELGVAATFQPLWAYPDEWVTEMDLPLLGPERTNRMYPIGSIHRAGGMIAGGSDWWVTTLNPLEAIEVGITRQDPYSNDGPALDKLQGVDLETMLAAYTVNGAYLMHLEDVQGSIEVGKRADLVVLDRNLFQIPPSEISEAKVLLTVFDGEFVYDTDDDS